MAYCKRTAWHFACFAPQQSLHIRTYLNLLTSHSRAFWAGFSSSRGPTSVMKASSTLLSFLFSASVICRRSSSLLCSLNRLVANWRKRGSSAHRSRKPSWHMRYRFSKDCEPATLASNSSDLPCADFCALRSSW